MSDGSADEVTPRIRFTLSRAAGGLGLMIAPAIYGAYGPSVGMALGVAGALGIVSLWGLAGASRRERAAQD